MLWAVNPDLLRWWKPKFRALDPLRELTVDEVADLYAERQAAPYRDLATKLVIAERPADLKVLLCGARGSGKSTELTRLAHEVRDRFCVVHADLAAGLPDQAGTLAVLILLGTACLHALSIWSNDPDTFDAATHEERVARQSTKLQAAIDKLGAMPNIADILKGIAGVVTVFEPSTGTALKVAATTAKAAEPSLRSAAAAIKHALSRQSLDGRLPPDKRDDAVAVVAAVNDVVKELESAAGRPALLLADGLDKRTSVEDVRLALSEEYLLQDLQAPLVLTGPVHLRHDARFRNAPGNFRLSLLYNIPVYEREAGPSDAGIEALRMLYERRCNAADISHDLISPEFVTEAALMSSGIIRDFLHFLYDACQQAFMAGRRAVSESDIHAALKARRLEMEGFLDEHKVDLLRRVLEKGLVPVGNEADLLLFENFIACYPNGDVWFRPHELLVEYVQRQSNAANEDFDE